MSKRSPVSVGFDEWIDGLNSASVAAQKSVSIPRGWFTKMMFADHENLTMAGADYRIREWLRRGILERKLHPRPTGGSLYIYHRAKKNEGR